MRNNLLFAILLFSTAAQAQFEVFFSDFLPLEEVPCPFDPTVQILKPVEWLTYQTQNGLWDGPVDSTRCITMDADFTNNVAYIPLDFIDADKPLFIRFDAPVLSDYPLDANQIFNVSACVDFYPDTLLFSTGTACEEGVCSGMFIGIAIPDSNGVANAATRYQTALTTKNEFFCSIQACFPSENFVEQNLRQLVLKFSFPAGADLIGKKMNLHYLTLNASNPWNPPGMVFQVDALPSQLSGGQYDVPISESGTQGPFGTYLMRYNANTYPSPQHQSYVEAAPVPNSSTPQVINLLVSPFETLEIQPYTNFRGALVAGSDSLRHTANLVNMGGDFCFNFIDLIFSGGDEYRHGGGTITMNHPRSCMQFRDGSKLRVLEGATLHYGTDGAGMLVVCADAGIVLERNATLIVDGTLSLSECSDNPAPQHVDLELYPGSSLIFTKNAVLTNQFSNFQQTNLRVKMLGGTLDDNALSPEERALIQLEYPVPSPVFKDNIEVYPNPFSEAVDLQYLAAETESIQVKWLSLDGRVLLEKQLFAQKGLNAWKMDGPPQAGVYLVVLESTKGRATQKVVKAF